MNYPETPFASNLVWLTLKTTKMSCNKYPRVLYQGNLIPSLYSVAYIGGAVVLLPPLGVPGGALPPPGKSKIKRKQI